MDRSFLYKSGEFLPAGDMPVDEDGDIHGYFDTQTVGQINDIHYVLWETNPDSQPAFIVGFFMGSGACYISVTTWPDLLSLLSMLSPIIMTALTSRMIDRP